MYTINRDIIYPKDASATTVETEIVDKLITAGHADLYVDADEEIVVFRVTGKHMGSHSSRLEERYAVYHPRQPLDRERRGDQLFENLAREIENAFNSEYWLRPAESSSLTDSEQKQTYLEEKVYIDEQNAREDLISPSFAYELLTGGAVPADGTFELESNRSPADREFTGLSDDIVALSDEIKAAVDNGTAKAPLVFGAASYSQAIGLGRACTTEGTRIVVGGANPENHFSDATLIIKYRQQTQFAPLDRWTKRQVEVSKQNLLESKVEAALTPIRKGLQTLSERSESPHQAVNLIAIVGDRTVGEWQVETRFDAVKSLPDEKVPGVARELIDQISQSRDSVPEAARIQFDDRLDDELENALERHEEGLVQNATAELDTILQEYIPKLALVRDTDPNAVRIRLLREVGGGGGTLQYLLDGITATVDGTTTPFPGGSREIPSISVKQVQLFGLLFVLGVGIGYKYFSVLEPYYLPFRSLLFANIPIIGIAIIGLVTSYLIYSSRHDESTTVAGSTSPSSRSSASLSPVQVPIIGRIALAELIPTPMTLFGAMSMVLIGIEVGDRYSATLWSIQQELTSIGLSKSTVLIVLVVFVGLIAVAYVSRSKVH